LSPVVKEAEAIILLWLDKFALSQADIFARAAVSTLPRQESEAMTGKE
jgi:hypothetical protein